MRHFTVKFLSRQSPPLDDLMFSAEDPASAYHIARSNGRGHPVELWEGTKRLGTLTEHDADYWQLG